jgi:hypothetical protein
LPIQLGLLFGGRDLKHRWSASPDRRTIIADTLFSDVMEKRVQSVVVPLADGVELVVVAAGAREGQAEPSGGGGLNSVEAVFGEEFLRNNAAFFIDHVVPVEPGGDPLI